MTNVHVSPIYLFSWKSDLQSMTKEQLEESVRSAASAFVTTTDLHLGKVQLNDPTVKFQASFSLTFFICSRVARLLHVFLHRYVTPFTNL